LGPVAVLPVASAVLRGAVCVLVGNVTTADGVYACLQSATGTYSWKLITSG